MEKAYIANLKFGVMRRQLWFSGKDDAETEAKWQDALTALDQAAETCFTVQEFYKRAVRHFRAYGFQHIAK